MKLDTLAWCPRHEAPAEIEHEWEASLPGGKPATFQTLAPCGCTVVKP